MMNRREFLTALSRGAVHSSGELLAEMPVRTDPCGGTHTVPMAGSPRHYRKGDLVYVKDARAWLGLDEIGFYAIDAICPHLGCCIKHVSGHFVCSGHGARFNADGTCEAGPAPCGLRYVQIDLDEDGYLVINRDITVGRDERLVA